MLLDLVRQARRRLITNDLFSQGANALSAALFALILLLLLGTQILDWYWLVLLPLGAIALGLYRVWSRRPTDYAAAQVIDRRLELADTLSTAFYFDDETRRARVPEAVRQRQYEQAQRLCPQVDLAVAAPYRAPRTLYIAMALLLVASSLFALRYGLSHTLDLRPPLARIIHRSLGGPDPVQRAATKKDAPRVPDLLDQMGMSVGDRDMVDKQAPIPATAPGAEAIADPEGTRSSGKLEDGDQISTGEPGEEGEEGGAPGDKAGDGQKGAGTSKEGEQASNQPQGGSSEKNSMLDKFKEAMQNLLSKMKIQPPPGGQQSSQMAQSKQGKNPQSGGKQSGTQAQKRDGSQEDGSQEGEAGEDAQNQQNSQSKGAGQNNEQQANKQPGSGIGKQDGDKDVKLAEQMAAMGKLSEIIGKRSANVSGEAMVEVKNTSQSLATRYESRRATHGESGAEIHRDEVPVALQGYVQQYFEQVRKSEQKAATK